MASAKERLRIFENIMARVGADGPVLEEYSKAMSTLNGLQTMQDMAPPIAPPTIPTSAPQEGSLGAGGIQEDQGMGQPPEGSTMPV